MLKGNLITDGKETEGIRNVALQEEADINMDGMRKQGKES